MGEVIHEGVETDGVLRKTLECHCRRCGQANLGLPGDFNMAAAQLRSEGWVTRGGKWVCRWCAPITPRGSRFHLSNKQVQHD